MIDENYSLVTSSPPYRGEGLTVIAAAITMLSICRAPVEGYMVPVPTGPARVVSAGCYQRSFAAPPENGTLITPSPDQAWSALMSVKVDPTVGVNKVTNVGNIYQCIQDGITASVGGPTGTSTSISDGTALWIYLGAQNTYSTIAGSQIVGISARGTQSTVGNVPPFDNDSGGPYTQIYNTPYSGFPDSLAGIWYRSTPSNNKTNLSGELVWGGTSPGSGAGDEATVMWLELQNVATGAPHTSSNVERSSATANIVSAASITTTVPCLIVSVWFGNGNVITAGTSHTAIPLNGLNLIPNADALVSLSANGYIQVACAWCRRPPGTYTEQWQTTGEGAQVMVVAFADASTITAADGDELPYWLAQPAPIQPITRSLITGVGADDIVQVSATIVDDSYWAQPIVAAPNTISSIQLFDQNELPLSITFDEDYRLQLPIPVIPPIPVFSVADQNELPLSITFDEDYRLQLSTPIAPPIPLFSISDQNELPLSITFDEDYCIVTQSITPSVIRTIFVDQDDLPEFVVMTSVIDDQPWSQQRVLPQDPFIKLFFEQDELAFFSISAMPDEDYWFRSTQPIVEMISRLIVIDDQMVYTTITPMINEDYLLITLPYGSAVSPIVFWQRDDDIASSSFVPPTSPIPVIGATVQIGKDVTLLTPTANIAIQQSTQIRVRDRSLELGSDTESGAFSRVDDLSAVGIVTTENIK